MRGETRRGSRSKRRARVRTVLQVPSRPPHQSPTGRSSFAKNYYLDANSLSAFIWKFPSVASDQAVSCDQRGRECPRPSFQVLSHREICALLFIPFSVPAPRPVLPLAFGGEKYETRSHTFFPYLTDRPSLANDVRWTGRGRDRGQTRRDCFGVHVRAG